MSNLKPEMLNSARDYKKPLQHLSPYGESPPRIITVDKDFPKSGEVAVRVMPTSDSAYRAKKRGSPKPIELKEPDLGKIIEKKGWNHTLRVQTSPKR